MDQTSVCALIHQGGQTGSKRPDSLKFPERAFGLFGGFATNHMQAGKVGTDARVEHPDRGLLRGDRSARHALLAFAGVEAAAFPLILVLGHYLWFHEDEWDFLGRTAGDLGDLLRPHNEHWSTLPILVYRLLWWLVGLRSYVPYQAVLVLLHLTAAVLLRTVMRRAGVGPWISTAAASLFVLFGAGRDDIIWPFQIGHCRFVATASFSSLSAAAFTVFNPGRALNVFGSPVNG
jgi:hypothetical protein